MSTIHDVPRTPQNGCAAPYVLIGMRCYFANIDYEWADAQTNCRTHFDGFLAEFDATEVSINMSTAEK